MTDKVKEIMTQMEDGVPKYAPPGQTTWGCGDWRPCVMELLPKPLLWQLIDFHYAYAA